MLTEIDTAIARLATEGVRIDLDKSNRNGDVFIAELPSGERCKLVGARLLKLMDEGKLNVAGILETRMKR